MATVPASSAPLPALDPTSTSQHPAQTKQQHFDLAIAISLGLWGNLNTAVVNGWGGPDSEGKRDWFAGAISDLFITRPETDEEDLECVLLQIMEDEFDVRVEDESEVEVAAQIFKLRRTCEKGDFSEVQQLQQRWTNAQSRRPERVVVEERNQDADSDEEDADTMDVDEEMEDAVAPVLVPSKQTREPELDEDGFTKVVSKKKR